MHLTALCTSLPLPFEESVERIAELGFGYVDVVGMVERPMVHLEALAATSLLVSCAAVGRGLPAGQGLDAMDPKARRAAVSMVKRQIDDASTLGATSCYLTAGNDASRDGLACFADACVHLAEHARQRMIRLCIEHVPGRALPTVTSVLDWLISAGHPNLYLLLDIGHCLISKERPRLCIERAAGRLRYVHLDDNDGKADLHLSLLSGVLKQEVLADTLSALVETGYEGALCLELNGQLPSPVEALSRDRELLSSLLDAV